MRWAAKLFAAPLAVRDREQPADAIVVVGAPLRGGALTAVGEERVRAGVDLFHRALAPLLCLSGGGPGQIVDGAPREADAMAERARALGVPDDALRVERESTSTADNARMTAALLAPDACRRIWLVTQPFHTRRCRYWFRRAGFDVLAWYAGDSIQFDDTRRQLRWAGREYAAWARMVAFELRLRMRRP